MFAPSRDEVRQFFFKTWEKSKYQQVLTDLEKMALGIIVQHPEYHAILDAPQRYTAREYAPELGETNPFLHLSMHLSIEEQLSINQPVGIAAAYRTLCEKYQDAHVAQHEVMDCLAEMVWHAQRYQTPPDPARYFSCLSLKCQQDLTTTPLPTEE